MKRFYIIGFMALLLIDTLSQVALKLAAMHTAPAALDIHWLTRLLTEGWVYVVIACYLGAFFTYMTLLKHAPIGPAFATTHLEIITVTLFSVLVFGETFSVFQIIGSVLIIAGIALLGSEKPAENIA